MSRPALRSAGQPSYLPERFETTERTQGVRTHFLSTQKHRGRFGRSCPSRSPVFVVLLLRLTAHRGLEARQRPRIRLGALGEDAGPLQPSRLPSGWGRPGPGGDNGRLKPGPTGLISARLSNSNGWRVRREMMRASNSAVGRPPARSTIVSRPRDRSARIRSRSHLPEHA